MPQTAKKLILAVVIALVALVLVFKSRSLPSTSQPSPTAPPALPRIVCIGAGTCIPCKAMEPVREEVRQEYAGRMIVEFHDLRQNPKLSKLYGVRVIPTTIFYDSGGVERGRVEGFMNKQDILDQFSRLGISL